MRGWKAPRISARSCWRSVEITLWLRNRKAGIGVCRHPLTEKDAIMADKGKPQETKGAGKPGTHAEKPKPKGK